ncbi:MAG: enoyl-CoA hydratase/isomerase family protein [Deltaproteobacteria bacterium]|nr:enoyl-CoA hydratase/isomerase family protein [Deltaproteobacteria bacterium]
MSFVLQTIEDSVATLTLNRGKVNAINEAVAEELGKNLEELVSSNNVKTVVLTGLGRFFSFGLDIPEFLNYSKQDFNRFVVKFADLYTYIFTYPKPVIAALNGHTIAGGFMLATACDYRVMVTGKSRISLNEITFGSSLFPGSAEMLRYLVGNRKAEIIAVTGDMYTAEQAKEIGLIDMVSTEESLTEHCMTVARGFVLRFGPAYQSIKKLLRSDTAATMRDKDSKYREEMIDHLVF